MNRYNDNSNDLKYVIQIIVSCFIIFISIAAIYVVCIKVSEIKILERINLKEDTHNSISITTDTNMGTSLFVTDEKGLRFRKEDKTFAREEWIDKNGELFYFDTSGYGLNGELKKEGQVYTFENGKLKDIKRDTAYVARADQELYSSIESAQYMVWLVSEEKEKNFYPIKYRQYSDDTEDYLGTINDKQYASPNLVKIYMSDIYYLAAGKGTSYAGKLCRMRPGAEHKETVGLGVTGFIVLSEDVVYYCDGSHVIKAKGWKSEDVEALDPEDAEIIDALTSTPLASDSEIDDIVLPKLDDETKEPETEKEETKEKETIKKVEIEISDLPVPDAKVKIETEDVSDNKKVGVRVDGPVAIEAPN